MSKVNRFLRPRIRAVHAYLPGEQPRIKNLIKLNTNENPYPPAPAVLRAVRAAADARLRLYPDSSGTGLRKALAAFHRCDEENFVLGNGSDELLALATRAFVEPATDPKHARSRSTVQYFTPSYSVYPVLAAIHGAGTRSMPLEPDFGLPTLEGLKRGGVWDFRAALTFITTPNAPTGRGYSRQELERICRAQRGVVILDEAYVDFAEGNALPLALKYPHVLVARTFSKAYALCFQRVGYLVGHPELIAGLHKIRDSYNVNGLGQVAAMATLDAISYYRRNFDRIVATRERFSQALVQRGFDVAPSQTNFVFVRPPRFVARDWMQKLRARRILVRWFDHPNTRNHLRITIGTAGEMNALLQAVDGLLGAKPPGRKIAKKRRNS